MNSFFDTFTNTFLRLLKVLRGEFLFFKIGHHCKKRSLGNRYASFTINPDLISEGSLVYSFGIGTDISFDTEIIREFKVLVFAFDPTPKSINWLSGQALPKGFKAFPYGLAEFSGEATFYLPINPAHVSASLLFKQSDQKIVVQVKRLKDIVNELGHQKLDILKMDIEGAEYAVIDDILNSGVQIRQILIEFHHRFHPDGLRKTRESIRKLKQAGYELFHVSSTGEEFSFLKLT